MTTPPGARRISVILFDGFELLDVFGPVELLNLVDAYTVEFASPTGGSVASSQGVQVIAEKPMKTSPETAISFSSRADQARVLWLKTKSSCAGSNQ